MPTKDKFLELFEKVRAHFPYGAPLSGDLMPAKESLENDFFANHATNPEYKNYGDWYPFSTEDLKNSVQTLTSRFNYSMSDFECQDHQADVLDLNISLNARGEYGQVLNKKGKLIWELVVYNLTRKCCYCHLLINQSGLYCDILKLLLGKVFQNHARLLAIVIRIRSSVGVLKSYLSKLLWFHLR